MPTPVLTHAHLTLRIQNKSSEEIAEFPHHPISIEGTGGLSSDRLNPDTLLGKKIEVWVALLPERKPFFSTQATVVREETETEVTLGLIFHLSQEQKSMLQRHLEKHGTAPKDYQRKFPRIPAKEVIGTYPLRVLVESSMPGGMVFDVLNISPSGILLTSENALTNVIAPGQQISMTLQPRGSFAMEVVLPGKVKRVVDSIHPISGNPDRQIGVQFLKPSELNRAAFQHLVMMMIQEIIELQRPAADLVELSSRKKA